jgi:hypothetical protein
MTGPVHRHPGAGWSGVFAPLQLGASGNARKLVSNYGEGDCH